MSAAPSFYITTAISYPNGEPHIGHAYEAIATDAIARFKRLDGYDTYFLTGTDEHGLKMQQAAIGEGITPKELSDRNSQRFRDMVAAMGCSNDDFIRTTEARHRPSVQEVWRRMEASGDIYLDKYAGWYSVRDEAFYGEDETSVGEDGVRVGGQGTPVEWTEEETYFFRLSAYQDRLLAHYEANPAFIQPDERRNEVLAFVKGGLQDLSISRTTFEWGIPVPGAPAHIMYVWVDALTNYITGVGFPDTQSDIYRRFWPADVHIIGKDISRFHAVYWPAFLMSAGIELPKQVFAHGFVLYRGEKMGKSAGNAEDPFELVKRFGLDQIRYFFLREISFGRDGHYSHEAIVTRTNADLANNLGNLAQRSLAMIAKHAGGAVPEPGEFSDADKAMLAAADGLLDQVRTTMERLALHRALEAIWVVVAQANRYFDEQEPWALRKTDPAAMARVLYLTIEVVRQVAVLIQPFMPQSATRLLDAVGAPREARTFAALGEAGRLAPGTPLPAPEPVFPRYAGPDVEAD